MQFTADNRHEWAIPEGKFSEWRDERGISALSCPYILYRDFGRKGRTKKCLPVGIQNSFIEEDMRRQYVVLYRAMPEGQFVSIRVQGV